MCQTGCIVFTPAVYGRTLFGKRGIQKWPLTCLLIAINLMSRRRDRLFCWRCLPRELKRTFQTCGSRIQAARQCQAQTVIRNNLSTNTDNKLIANLNCNLYVFEITYNVKKHCKRHLFRFNAKDITSYYYFRFTTAVLDEGLSLEVNVTRCRWRHCDLWCDLRNM